MMDIKDLQALTSAVDILYVEDDIDVQKNTKIIFDDLFHEVTTANNGLDGLETYKQDAKKYEIVITDIRMPKMDGLEMIHEIKKFIKTKLSLSYQPIMKLNTL